MLWGCQGSNWLFKRLNSFRPIVILTSNGKVAHFFPYDWHETMDGGYLGYLTRLGGDNVEFLLEFLDKVEDFLQIVIDTDS
jgi:hypothetical protein